MIRGNVLKESDEGEVNILFKKIYFIFKIFLAT